MLFLENVCILLIDKILINTNRPADFVNNPYPQDWDNLPGGSSLNPGFSSNTSTHIFNSTAIVENILYPRQNITVTFCVTVEPDCNGRTFPLASPSGLTFDNTVDVTSINEGNDTFLYDVLQDFHTTETTVAANLFIPDPKPLVNFDGTYNFSNRVIITNDGVARADDVNYNMGLGNFLDIGEIVFTDITVTQIANGGPTVQLNLVYDGDTSTKLLEPNNSLEAGETVILQIDYEIGVISSAVRNVFSELNISMTQGALDGFDESSIAPVNNLRRLSFVTWSDALGNHVDRYYQAATNDETPSSDNQCNCPELSMVFLFKANLAIEKTIFSDEPAASGILENRAITFQIALFIVRISNKQCEHWKP